MSKEIKRLVERAVAAFTVLALGTGITITSLLSPAVAHAFPTGGQVQSRAIYMSNSTPAAAASYLVSWKPANTTALQGVIVDFCSTSPIIGDTCSSPDSAAGSPTFTVGATPTIDYSTTTMPDGSTATTGLPGTWTASSLNSGRTLKLVTTGAATSGALSTSTIYNFKITSMVNPALVSGKPVTFYARIITYTSNSGDIASYTAATPGSTDALDYGGFALSTASNITVTAKVQESLTFCTSALNLTDVGNTGTNNNCTFATAPVLTLGHGTPAPGILDNTAVDSATAYTQASTNASNGLVIRMHATNSCANAGLSSNGGSTCNITGLDNTTATGAPGAVAAGTTFFGLFVSASATTVSAPTSTGTITPDGNYNDGTNTNEAAPATVHYGMDNTAGGVTSTYGDKIASSTGPVSQVNNHLMFAATAGLTVPAGIYTGQESLIATGTF